MNKAEEHQKFISLLGSALAANPGLLLNKERMEISVKQYLKPLHPYAFRSEISVYPEITGKKNITPKGLTERECYELTYPDGFVDHIPTSEVVSGNYVIVDKDRD